MDFPADEAEVRKVLENVKKRDGQIDFAYMIGVLASSKEMWCAIGDDGETVWKIFHGVDGTITMFSQEHAVDVLMDRRSAWDGTPELEERYAESPNAS